MINIYQRIFCFTLCVCLIMMFIYQGIFNQIRKHDNHEVIVDNIIDTIGNVSISSQINNVDTKMTHQINNVDTKMTHQISNVDTKTTSNFICTHIKPNQSYQSIVAVAFYGMSRNLVHTLPSIKRRVFDVLQRNDILYDVFWHTLIIDEIHSRRNDIEDGPINAYDVKLISPCRFTLSDQDTIHQQEFQQFMIARKLNKDDIYSNNTINLYDPWKDNFKSVKNLLGAFYTLNGVYEIIASYSIKTGLKYDAIIVIRPDTAMIKDIDLPLYINDIKNSNTNGNGTIWIPHFQHYRGYNDRAAYGSMNAMKSYMKRGLIYRDYFFRSSTSEVFLKIFVRQHNITVKFSSMRVLRIRQNNVIATADRQAAQLRLLNNDSDLLKCIPEDKLYLLPTC